MKMLWIGTMAVTFLLGAGIVAVVLVLGKMALAYARTVS